MCPKRIVFSVGENRLIQCRVDSKDNIPVWVADWMWYWLFKMRVHFEVGVLSHYCCSTLSFVHFAIPLGPASAKGSAS